jgi:hypothetical protein
MVRVSIKRLGVAVSVTAFVLSLSASAVFAGEITGNGKVLKVDDSKWGTGLHARSFCAFSGQEDLQFLDEEGNPLPEPTKGSPAHAQSWGQIPKEFRDFLATIGAHPGQACNPNVGPPPEPEG